MPLEGLAILYEKYTDLALSLDAELVSRQLLWFIENGFQSRFYFTGTEIFPNFASPSLE